jgi:predicted nucleotidyltransferase component of viral defense system
VGPALTARDTDAAVLQAEDGQLTVRLQILNRISYPPWPTHVAKIEQRYSDVSPAALRVPTAAAFAAWKTVAWHDRGAPRDLWDLWALAQRGHITAEAAQLFVANGPTGSMPQPWMFTTAPPEDRWREQLAGQTRLTVTAADALRMVSAAWTDARKDLEQ